MSTVEGDRAQKWHDSDHGRSDEAHNSACWCCCILCDPDWDPPRPNPYWAAATEEMRREFEQQEGGRP